MSVQDNLKNILKYTSNAKVIAVTKYVSAQKVMEAYDSGIRDFGESKVQDAEKKRAELPEELEINSNWHFLGHLQTNKVKKIVGKYKYIHSVDSLKLANAISDDAQSKNIVQKILLQVNIAKEEAKYGFNSEEIEEVYSQVSKLSSVDIAGLMTMAPFTSDSDVQRSVFRELKKLSSQLKDKFDISLPELSMGMSNDYKIAIEEGATMVRIGKLLFI